MGALLWAVYRSSYDDDYQPDNWLTGLDLEQAEWLWALLAAAVVALLVLFAVLWWRRLRPSLFNKSKAVLELEKPGQVSVHLETGRWAGAFAATLEWAGRLLGREQGAGAHAASDALKRAADAGAALADAARDAAVEALKLGELRSVLVESQGTMIYVLLFPGRHEHRGLFRRYEPFARGWSAHAARLRRTLAAGGRVPPLLCLFFFLSPRGGEGAALLAYEADEGRLVPEDLMGASEAGGAAPITERHEFRLA